MADPFGDDDTSGGAGKRPAPTIEGTATEVSVAEPGDESDEVPPVTRYEEPVAPGDAALPQDDMQEGAAEAEAPPTQVEPEPAEIEA